MRDALNMALKLGRVADGLVTDLRGLSGALEGIWAAEEEDNDNEHDKFRCAQKKTKRPSRV